MECTITRAEAWELLRKYNKEPFHLLHGLTVEGVMRWYAKELGFEEEADFWGIVGLLHDVDFEQYPDELTGLIGAAARMRPSKSTQDMEISSLKKKFKDKRFAAGCSREIIRQGADLLGWELDELFFRTIQAMRGCEAEINSQMEAMVNEG